MVLSVVSRDNEKPMASLIHGPGGNVLDSDLNKLARDVARQVVGFPTRAIEKQSGVEEEETLLEQSFMMLGKNEKVKEVLESWGQERGVRVTVVGMKRWSVGDNLEASTEA